ncbi:MAG: tetraacyldisaccharide 4'-kinase, partial [bacterium]
MSWSAEPWNRRGPLWTPCLWLVSGFYALGWKLVRLWHGGHPTSVNAPTLSVGNLSVGGTGKSIVVRALARRAARA